jgi:tRNA threonylcarbamoyladenosine modification (KEOPS) complex Cgi121 subunit
MLHYIEEFGRYVEITGYGNIAFAQAEAFLKTHRKQAAQVELQFFDAGLVATEEHLYFAVLNALQAFRSKTNISKSVAMETMLFASAQQQIQKSIEHIGVKPQSKNLAVIIVSEDIPKIEAELEALTDCFGTQPDASVLQLTGDKQKRIRAAFEITEEEIKTENSPIEKAIMNLVIEHVALLATQL